MEQEIPKNQMVNISQELPPVSQPETLPEEHHHHKKNIYPLARHTLLIVLVLFATCVIFFLVHQNGKSIYDNGI